jgi:hypothetical protein
MTLPNLPTDNLYKFLALSGLLLAVISFAFPMKLIYEAREQLLSQQTEFEVLKIELESIHARVESAEMKGTLGTGEGRELLEKHYKNEIALVKVNSQAAKIRLLSNEIESWKLWMAILVGLGIFFAVVGFILWYQVVQAPADKLLRLQLVEAQARLEKSRQDT